MKLIQLLSAILTLSCLVISCDYNKGKLSLNDIETSAGKPEQKVSLPSQKPEDENKITEDFLNANENNNQDTAKKFNPQKTVSVVKENPQAKTDWDKKIIKTASLQVQVKDYSVYSSSLRDKIKQLGGYTAQEEQNQSDYKIENNVIIKVPVDQFENAVTLLTSGIEKLNEKKITSQDVTTEVVDTRSRLEAKKQVRLRYLDLLKQAKNMSEILNVQQEVNGIQEEIESATGRIGYLSHSATFSTINLTFFQVLDVSAKDTAEPSFWTKIATSFKNGWNWTGNLLITLTAIWPLILFFIIAWVFVKKYKTRIKSVIGNNPVK